MEKSILALNELVPLAVGIAIFVLIWVVIFETLKKAPFFKNQAANAVVATCVTLLSVISIFRCFEAGNKTSNVSSRISDDGAFLDFILLPYGALGITIILMLCFFGGKFLRKNKTEKSFRGDERRTEPILPLDLCKSNRIAEENFTEAFEEIEADRDNRKALKPIDRLSEEHVHQSNNHKGTKSNRIKQ